MSPEKEKPKPAKPYELLGKLLAPKPAEKKKEEK